MVQILSQFKKAMKDGAMFEVVEHFRFPERNGEIRKANMVKTTGMYTILPYDSENIINQANKGKGSWIEFGKASDYTFVNGLIQQSFMGNPIWTLRIIEN